MKEYEHDIEKEGQIDVDLHDDDGKKIGRATVGVGHPDGNKISADPRLIDEKGNPVVKGLPWGDCSTGVWLSVAVAPEKSLGAVVGNWSSEAVPLEDLRNGHGYWMHIGCSHGLPSFTVPVVGASLEIPVDLANDTEKQKYVAEWLAHTAQESARLALPGDHIIAEQGKSYMRMAIEVSKAANEMIGVYL